MNQADYLEAFKQECHEEMALTSAKNKDYAGQENAFANFELIEILTAGRITTEDGILVRMTDKLKRVANLLERPAAVKDEKITDTLRDLSVYAKILKIRLDGKPLKAAELKDNSALPGKDDWPMDRDGAAARSLCRLRQRIARFINRQSGRCSCGHCGNR